MIVCQLQLAYILVFLGTCHAIREYNMFHHCGKLISMIRNDIKDALLFYVDDSKYTDGRNPCIVELWGWFENDVAMHFRSLSLTYNTSIEIRQGDEWDIARPIAGLPKILNSTFNQLNQVYTSDWLGIFIAIHNPPARYGPRLFELALNVFHSGRCEKWEYRCDNGWCIDEDLKCNGNNPCSDNSDCGPEGPSSGVIAVICVSTISGAGLILAIVYYVVRHYVKKRRRLQTAARFQDEAARTNHYSWSRQNDQHHDDATDHSYGYQVHSRWNNNDTSLNNLFDDEHSLRSHRTNRMEPPNYNSITTDNNMANDTANNTNRPNPPDYNTAVMGTVTSDRLGPEPSAPRQGPEPSAPRLDFGPSAPTPIPEPSTNNQPGQDESSDLPSYNDVLQNEDAYRLNLQGDKTVVYRV